MPGSVSRAHWLWFKFSPPIQGFRIFAFYRYLPRSLLVSTAGSPAGMIMAMFVSADE
jgi:hypothetical protein